jgi:hypothetical protein
VQLASDGVQCTVVTALGPGLLALQVEVEQQELLAELEPLLEAKELLLVGLLALVQHRGLRALLEQQAVPLVPQVQLSEREVLLAQMAEQVRQLEFLEQVQELQPCVLWERAADHRLSLVDPFFVLLETRVAHSAEDPIVVVHSAEGLIAVVHSAEGLIAVVHSAEGLIAVVHSAEDPIAVVHSAEDLIAVVHSAEDLIVEGPIVGLNAEQALEQTSANSAVNRMTACDDMIDLDTHIAASYPVDIDDVPQYRKKPVLPVSSNQRIPLSNS